MAAQTAPPSGAGPRRRPPGGLRGGGRTGYRDLWRLPDQVDPRPTRPRRPRRLALPACAEPAPDESAPSVLGRLPPTIDREARAIAVCLACRRPGGFAREVEDGGRLRRLPPHRRAVPLAEDVDDVQRNPIQGGGRGQF